MNSPRLSVVVPLHNEAEILLELVARLEAAVSAIDGGVEIVLVDDASTDATATLLAGLEGIQVVSLSENVGQFRATCAGLAVATAEAVAVLDGDLQDPPETLPALLDALGGGELAFAVKTRREDPLWFRVGRGVYRALATLGQGVPPSGAGSYCVMERRLAQRVAESPWKAANLASVVVTIAEGTGPWPQVEYAKSARYDGRSRVGFWGLVEEALGSLRVTRALQRILWGLGLCAVSLWVGLLLL